MRYYSIDILRTMAIAVMVIVHFSENLSGFTPPFEGFGAPIFALLSGMSYQLWVDGQQRKGISEMEISKVSIRRGLFVFFVGFAFNIFVWLPEDTFIWDVLTLIGMALLILNGARQLPITVLVWAAATCLLISPVLRQMAEYDTYWIDDTYEADLTLSDVIIGFLVTGYFPVFPWLTFSIAGLTIAKLMFPMRRNQHVVNMRSIANIERRSSDAEISRAMPQQAGIDQDQPVSVIPLVGCGLLAMMASAILMMTRSYLPDVIGQKVLGGWYQFPATIEYVLGTIGMTLVAFAVLIVFVDRNPRAGEYRGLLNIAKTFSRYSFSIYVLHHLVHLWPLWIYGIMQGQEPTYYWKKAMPVSVSVPLAIIFLVGCFFLFRKLGPERRIGIEGWMRWLCD